MTEAQPLKAAAWMTGAIVSFTSMAVAGREVSPELDTFELMMYRSAIGVVIVCASAAALGKLREIDANRLFLHGFRNLAHFAGQNLWFFALTQIPLALVIALEFTSPIWVVLLAPLFLGERLTPVRLLSALIGFVGILIAARPGAVEIGIGFTTAALAAIGFALTMLATKRLTRTTTITCILFWLTVMQLAFGVIAAGYDGDVAWPSLAIWPWVIVVALGGLMAHLCITTALTLAPAAIVAPVDFLRLPVVAIVGLLVYAEALDPFVLLGAVVIFGANYLNIWAERRNVSKI